MRLSTAISMILNLNWILVVRVLKRELKFHAFHLFIKRYTTGFQMISYGFTHSKITGFSIKYNERINDELTTCVDYSESRS